MGAVAAAGAGFVRVIGSQGAGNGQLNCPLGGVAFDGEGNLVVSDAVKCDGSNECIQVFRYSDGGRTCAASAAMEQGMASSFNPGA